jgi:hypothetical protein
MANATTNLTRVDHGQVGRIIDLPVAAATHIYDGTLLTQLTATGGLVPYSTASSGWVVGVAQHESDNSAGLIGDKRCRFEFGVVYNFANGAGGDAFADTDKIGSPVYGTDDHTAAKTSSTGARQPVGFFHGIETDGRVRVLVDPILARLYATLMALTDSPATADALRDNIVAGAAT